MVRTTALMTASTMLIGLSSAHAYVNTMYNVGFEPSTIGSQVAMLDSSGYAYNDPANLDVGRFNSGFTADILAPDGTPVFTQDSTSVVTRVFEVNTPTLLTDLSGDLQLETGDLIFAYTVDLVQASTNSVDTLSNFNLFASIFSNSDVFDATNVKGRGFTTAGLANGTTASPAAMPGDFGSNGVISTLDFAFPALQSLQMGNSESITFLMFTRPSLIETGFAGLSGEPGQAPSTTDPTANGVPVLVPIVPAPGATAIAGLAGITAFGRRRRNA